MNKPISCGSCSNIQRYSATEYICTKDSHLIDVSYEVIAERRDADCPMDKEGQQA